MFKSISFSVNCPYLFLDCWTFCLFSSYTWELNYKYLSYFIIWYFCLAYGGFSHACIFPSSGFCVMVRKIPTLR